MSLNPGFDITLNNMDPQYFEREIMSKFDKQLDDMLTHQYHRMLFGIGKGGLNQF